MVSDQFSSGSRFSQFGPRFSVIFAQDYLQYPTQLWGFGDVDQIDMLLLLVKRIANLSFKVLGCAPLSGLPKIVVQVAASS